MESTDIPVNVLLDFQETDVKQVSLLSNIQMVKHVFKKGQIRDGKIKQTYGQYWKWNWHKLFPLEKGWYIFMILDGRKGYESLGWEKC